jgi:hypothetical protein
MTGRLLSVLPPYGVKKGPHPTGFLEEVNSSPPNSSGLSLSWPAMQFLRLVLNVRPGELVGRSWECRGFQSPDLALWSEH